ncbi:MAG: hypothetical protein IJK96_04055 [Bacteroidales bacterium]|nr:hypothetical protein [Bacteroidales bacterium]
MKDIEQYLRENVPEIPEEGQFLIETNARLSLAEGIKKTVDEERRHWRIALTVALASSLALGCVMTLVVMFYPVRPLIEDGSDLMAQAVGFLREWRVVLVGLIAVCAVSLGVLFATKPAVR